MNSEPLTSKQISLRSLVLLVTVAAIILGVFVPLIQNLGIGELYLAPGRLISYGFGVVTLSLVIGIPIALIIIFTLLSCFPSPPKMLFVFLAVFVVAFIQLLAIRGRISSLIEFAQWMTPTLILLSLTTIYEVAYRRLRQHYVTAVLTLPIALAYWFCTLLIVSAV